MKRNLFRHRLLSRLDWYIIKKFLGTYFFSILLIVVIAVVFDYNEHIDKLSKATTHEILFEYYLNSIPYFANMFSPLFVFIAVIFFTSKLAENSEIIYPSKGSDLKDLSYDLSRKGHYLSGILSYTEPFGEFWALQTVASLSGNKSSAKEDAFNADKTLNDYYSSVSENRSYQQDYIARLQFKKEGLNVQVGGNVIGLAIDNYAKSFSRETTTGEGKWDWSLSPYIRIKESKGSHNLSFYLLKTFHLR